MEFLLSILGVLVFGVLFVVFGVYFSEKREQRRIKEKKAEDALRLSKIKSYLDNLSTSRHLTEEEKHLFFKLKNRWEIIYKWSPSYRPRGSLYLPPHPKVLSACAERDRIEVKLMDMGFQIEYPN